MSEPAVHYDSYTQGRAHLRNLLDAASEGRPATLRRDRLRAAIVDAERLRAALADMVALRAQVVAEAGGWSVFVPGVPVAADGATFDEAIDEMVDALREYARDWEERLRLAPNHDSAWPLVQFVALSDDEQLRAWLVGDQ
jgi:predicted RNase H-like HicB family nuclease